MKDKKKYDSFIYFLYTLLALNLFFYPDKSQTFFSVSSPETGHGMAVVNFNGFSVAVYCILVIHQ